MNLFTVPAHLPFLDAIAAEWLARAGAVQGSEMAAAQGLILLPTRRSARALSEAFLRVSDGKAMLLPRIAAIGALDETPLELSGALDLPPAVPEQVRLAALSRLIMAMPGRGGAHRSADRAWRLAAELASLMDEAERAEIDLAARLPGAAEPEFARHWALTLEFLGIVTQAWPAWLAEQGFMNPAARQVALLRAQTQAWQAAPPAHRVLFAGASAGMPAVAALARVVAGLPSGAVVLPALDLDMAEDAWNALEPSHAQAGLRAFLQKIGAARRDVRPWPVQPQSGVPAERAATLGRALLPGAALAEDWVRPGTVEIAGLSRLEARDQQEEATAIALILRDALETPGARAALVTPDRTLAGQVAAELLRWGIVADDSAGERLADTPPAVFLRLLARAAGEGLAPVPLLSLLKHPITACGLQPSSCRYEARWLEITCLRGPRPAPGLEGLRRRAEKTHQPTLRFVDRLADALAPLQRVMDATSIPPGEALRALLETAERVAASDAEPGADRLWAGEEGQALASHLTEVLEAVRWLPDQPPDVLAPLLDATLATAPNVRSRRALRGRGGAEHPRVFIWGLLEARLQHVELIVLGGLAEGVWPPASDPGPWLSRPMRARVGLPAAEETIGQAAHDFVGAAMAAPEVVLSCPLRIEGVPTVPARWLTRLDMLLEGRGQRLPAHPATGWTRQLDQPEGAAIAVQPPAPRPAPALRPRKLSVTEIETWLRDPYAIYARHILKLRPLDPLDQDTDAADYGTVVHEGIRRFLDEVGAAWPSDAARRLLAALQASLAETAPRDAVRNWWEPRLGRIAEWLVGFEARRRSLLPIAAVHPEVPGRLELHRIGGPFTLTGRADRIERRADGTLSIIDYKTGSAPGETQVMRGLAPQLPLEAAMAQAGAFGAACAGSVTELAYWRLSGGLIPGEAKSLFDGDPDEIAARAREAIEALAQLIDEFDKPERAYLSQPHPARAPRFTDYAQLARVKEWSGAEDAE